MDELIIQLENELAFGKDDKILFANEENQHLQNELIEKRKMSKKAREKMQKQEDRIRLMKEHLEAVLQTVQHNQQHQKALEEELSSEDHLQKLRQREIGWTLRETQRKKKAIEELQRKQEAAERTMTDYHTRIDSLRTAVTWEQETTSEWLDDAMQHEENNLSMLKTNHDAERKMKDLGKQLEKLHLDCRKWKASVENVYNCHLNLQQELMRMANDFRTVHEEREGVIALWEKALREMENRDVELQSLGREVDDLREKTEDLNEIKKEKENLLWSEEHVQKELELELSKLESTLIGLQKQMDLLRADDKLESEVVTLKCEAQGLSIELNRGRSSLKQLQKQFQERNLKLQQLRSKGRELEENMSSLRDESFSVERQVELVEANLDLSEREAAKLLVEEGHLGNLCAKKKDALRSVQEEMQSLTLAIKSADLLSSKLDQEIKKLTEASLQADTLLNSVNVQRCELEARVKKMSGQSREELEKKDLQMELEYVRRIFAKKREAQEILIQQLQESQSLTLRTKKDLEKTQNEKLQLKKKVDNIELITENTIRILKKVTASKQETSVDKSLLEVVLRKLQQMLGRHALSIESIQRQQLELELTVKQQLQQANSCQEMLQLEINLASQERQMLNTAWNSSKSQLEKLQARYEVLLNALPEKELVEQDPILLIDQAEAERDELSKKQQEIRDVVSRTQRESEALKNSLKLVESSNSGIRESAKPVSVAVEEHTRIQQLEEALHGLYKKIYEKQQNCRETQDRIDAVRADLQTMREGSAVKQNLLVARQRQVETLREALKTQNERIGRADVQTSRALAATRKLAETGLPKEEVHMDIRLRLFLDLQKRMNCLIAEAASQNPDVLPDVRSLFVQAQIPMPSLPETRSRSTLDSASSASSRSVSQVSLLNLDPQFPDTSSKNSSASTNVKKTGNKRRDRKF